jgi:uncharacterized membrane protein
MQMQHPRFNGFLLGFTLAGSLASRWFDPAAALVIGFDLAAGGFILSCLPLWRGDRVLDLQARAARDDGGRTLLTLVALLSLGVVLVALVRLVGAGKQSSLAEFAMVAGSLVIAWLFINLLYTFHYANIYHRIADDHPTGGLDFPGSETPLYADFVYFSFVIGMTCQVSDVEISSTELRRVATGHGLVAFFFNLGVLALMVNVLAGLL